MKAGNFTGIKGFPNGDIAMWLTMGSIADRTEERLGASDVAVVEFRRRMLDALKEFQSGDAAIGTGDKAIRAQRVLVRGDGAERYRLEAVRRPSRLDRGR